MPRLADPTIGPAVDLLELERARVRELRERWAMGDEGARQPAEEAERQLEALELRERAEAARKRLSAEELEAAIQAKKEGNDDPEDQGPRDGDARRAGEDGEAQDGEADRV